MTTESLTYSELGERLGSSPEAARSLARRLRLLRKPADDGKVRVIVDLAEIQYKPPSARSPLAVTDVSAGRFGAMSRPHHRRPLRPGDRPHLL